MLQYAKLDGKAKEIVDIVVAEYKEHGGKAATVEFNRLVDEYNLKLWVCCVLTDICRGLCL